MPLAGFPESGRADASSANVAWLQWRTVPAYHFAVTHCLIQSSLLPLVLFTQSPGRTPSSVGITLELYSHVLPGVQEDAAAKVDRCGPL